MVSRALLLYHRVFVVVASSPPSTAVVFRGTPGRLSQTEQLVETLPEADALEEKVASLRATYASLSELYQESKAGANAALIPLS